MKYNVIKNKKMTAKKQIIIAIIPVIIFLFSGNSFAIGEFSVGATIGATRDLNNLNSDVNRYNMAMEYYKETDPDAQVSQIPEAYNFVWGFSFKYQFNFILFRLGSQFSRSAQSYRGAITPSGGEENEIKISTYQNSYPFSIAFLVPFKERTFFYLGGGMSYNVAYLKITQSNPAETSGLLPDSNKRNRYTGDFVGYHLIAGAEAPVPTFECFTVSVEWIHQEGRSFPLSNGGIDQNGNKTYAPRRTLNIKGDFILFSLNYHITI